MAFVRLNKRHVMLCYVMLFSGQTNDNNFLIITSANVVLFSLCVFARVYFCQQIISKSCFYHVLIGYRARQ